MRYCKNRNTRIRTRQTSQILQATLKRALAPALVFVGLGITGAIWGYILALVVVGLTGAALLFTRHVRSSGRATNHASVELSTMLGYGLPLYAAAILSLFFTQYLMLLAALYLLTAISYLVIGNFLSGIADTGTVLKTSVVTLAVYLPLGPVLARFWGPFGLLIAYILSIATSTVYGLRQTSVKHDARPDLRVSRRIILAAVGAALPTLGLIQLDGVGVGSQPGCRGDFSTWPLSDLSPDPRHRGETRHPQLEDSARRNTDRRSACESVVRLRIEAPL